MIDEYTVREMVGGYRIKGDNMMQSILKQNRQFVCDDWSVIVYEK
jgi:hypothetical protein